MTSSRKAIELLARISIAIGAIAVSGCVGASSAVRAEREALKQRLGVLQADGLEAETRLSEARQLERDYRTGIAKVLEPKWAAAVVYHAEHRMSGEGTNLGEMCGEDLNVTAENMQRVPPSLRGDYRCDQDDNIGADWSSRLRGRSGSVDRLICAGSRKFTVDDFDGDLERSGPKAQVREDCMNGAENLARVLDEIVALNDHIELNVQHRRLLERKVENLTLGAQKP